MAPLLGPAARSPVREPLGGGCSRHISGLTPPAARTQREQALLQCEDGTRLRHKDATEKSPCSQDSSVRSAKGSAQCAFGVWQSILRRSPGCGRRPRKPNSAPPLQTVADVPQKVDYLGYPRSPRSAEVSVASNSSSRWGALTRNWHGPIAHRRYDGRSRHFWRIPFEQEVFRASPSLRSDRTADACVRPSPISELREGWRCAILRRFGVS